VGALIGAGVLVVLTMAAPRAGAQGGMGTVTGQVVWGSCLPGPLSAVPGANGASPASPSDAGQTMAPTPDAGSAASDAASTASGAAQPAAGNGQVVPAPGLGRRLPAGAVLVALEGSSVSTRTDESGHFSLDNVPTDTYWLLAAGPVSGVAGASSMRPNVIVQSGQTLDLGILVLGAPTGAGCRYPLAPQGVAPDPSGGAAPTTSSP
jgi:hypothetical protein